MDCYLSPGSQLPSFPDAAQVALGGSTWSCLYNHALVCWQQTHLCLHCRRRSHPVHFPVCNASFSVAHTRTLQNFQKVIFFLARSREAKKDPGALFLIHHSPHAGCRSRFSPVYPQISSAKLKAEVPLCLEVHGAGRGKSRKLCPGAGTHQNLPGHVPGALHLY